MSSKFGLIVLDTLRNDTFLEHMSQTKNSSVHIFEEMYSTSRWTPPAHASLFTGYYPTEVGVHNRQQYLTTPVPVLAEQFREAGYRTVGLSENINIDSFFKFDRGFQDFHRGPNIKDRPRSTESNFDWKELEKKISNSKIRRPLEAVLHILRSDAPSMQTLRTGFQLYRAKNRRSKRIDWAEPIIERTTESNDDLFIFANFMTPHYPYDPPHAYSPREPLFISPLELSVREEPVSQDEHERHLLNYEGASEYLDDVLPALIDSVDWDLLFVLSDHGELFGEHGMRGHHYGMYEELVHVPCVAFGNLVPNGTTSGVTSLVDVHRTFIERLGVDIGEHHRGIDLFEDPITEDRAVYAESEGCEWYSPEATGIEACVPKEWNEPHHMIRHRSEIYIHDKDGKRVWNVESCEEETDSKGKLETIGSDIRSSRRDYSGTKPEVAIPSHIESQLEYLGYR